MECLCIWIIAWFGYYINKYIMDDNRRNRSYEHSFKIVVWAVVAGIAFLLAHALFNLIVN